MAGTIACTCGKKYTWIPQLAGKRSKCKCGDVISFPADDPDLELPAKEDYPFASMDDLAALDGAGRIVESPPTSLPTTYSAPQTSRAIRPHTSSASPSVSGNPTMLQKIGVLAVGLAAMGFFALWPMVEVLKGEPSITVSFKGIACGAVLLMGGLNVIILGDRGIPWKKAPGQTLNTFQKACVAATVVAALIVTGLVGFFFKQHGYSVGF